MPRWSTRLTLSTVSYLARCSCPCWRIEIETRCDCLRTGKPPKLTLQFTAEGGKDSYSSPSTYGLQDTRNGIILGIDFAYAESFNWNFNGYLSHGVQSFNQSRYAGYVMAFENTSLNAGLGFTGKVNSNFEIGGNVTFSDEKSVYAQTLDRFATADSVALLAATGWQELMWCTARPLAKLFGNYALDKRSGIRVDSVHQRTKINDWALELQRRAVCVF